MRAKQYSDRLNELTERQTALKHVLRGAWMPSSAVDECVRRLRATIQDLEALADDIDEAQRHAALSTEP